MTNFKSMTLRGLLALSLLAAPAFAGELMKEYPEGGTFLIKSHPSFHVQVGDETELVTCDAELRVETTDAYVGENGKRRVDVKVLSWQADGVSELLGGDLHFRMTEEVRAKAVNYVESLAAGQDFPARAQFELVYELETPFGTVENLSGLTWGEVTRFPPQSGARFTMDKAYDAEFMAQLMPEAVSALSAAGETSDILVNITPNLCFDE